jgi:spore coat protein U-like protein
MAMKRAGQDCPHERRAAVWLRLAACMALMLCATCAQAGADCNITTTGVAFGIYDPLASTSDDSVGTVTVTCGYVAPGGTITVPFTLQLSAGGSGNFAQRQLASGTKTLGYNLYRDAARSQIAGSGTGGTYTITGSLTVGSGSGNRTRSQSYSIYGRVPALQDAAAGTYGDTIVATLTF